jgi:aspartyl-tRNA(Asn)/glutamyl-tRNA(Gln) amidotransferase subunit B
MKYKPVIGLEVHVELKTNSKMFCGCSADYFGKEPNTHTCPVCLGLPGALPYPNKKAVEWCLMIGLALKCDIPLLSKFDRKNYFYPDLAKGYQISQYDKPFCVNGEITLANGKKIRIRRVHMEEDTGKLVHATVNGEKVTLIDFNRSGVPLVEIVTEPDFESSSEVKEYLQKLQQLVRHLGVSNADMEKGDMRLEPNISLQKENEKDLPQYKVEVKNINSFAFAGKAIDYEIKRQGEILDEDKIPVQETRGFVEKNSSTISQRVKEEASDYRYFPEPDIPPIRWTEDKIEEIRSTMPELPNKKTERFVKTYGLSEQNAEFLTRDLHLAIFFEECIKLAGNNLQPLVVANYLINRKIDLQETTAKELIDMVLNDQKASDISIDELNGFINQAVLSNQKAVEDYKSGKEQALMFLLGQVARLAGKKIDIQSTREKLKTKLS